jgi:hypothetical protein
MRTLPLQTNAASNKTIHQHVWNIKLTSLTARLHATRLSRNASIMTAITKDALREAPAKQ